MRTCDISLRVPSTAWRSSAECSVPASWSWFRVARLPKGRHRTTRLAAATWGVPRSTHGLGAVQAYRAAGPSPARAATGVTADRVAVGGGSHVFLQPCRDVGECGTHVVDAGCSCSRAESVRHSTAKPYLHADAAS